MTESKLTTRKVTENGKEYLIVNETIKLDLSVKKERALADKITESKVGCHEK